MFCQFSECDSVRDISNGLNSANGNSSLSECKKEQYRVPTTIHCLLILDSRRYGNAPNSVSRCQPNGWVHLPSRWYVALQMAHYTTKNSLLPVFVNIIDGKCGGNRGALDIPVSPHSVVIADRGYCDFSLLDNWDNKNVFFVVRHRDNLHSQIEERLLPETRVQNVLIDEIIELTGEQTKKKYTKPLRRIAIWNDEHGYVVQLLTNNFKLSAPTIA